MKAYFTLLRPHQWFKNLFVLIPLVFAREFVNFDLVALSFAAGFVFILASSAAYVLNDLLDYEKDRKHPDKKKRPIASGAVSPRAAFFLWIALMALTIFTAFNLSVELLVVVLAYIVLTIAYSAVLKDILFLDVILIAVGFVLRVLAGGVAIGVTVTDWTIVLVFLFTLFLAISKRRQELKRLMRKARKTRSVLTQYTVELIDQLNAIIVPIVITSYIIYTFSERQNNAFFIATIPLVVYCFFRYLYLLKSTGFGESSSDYLHDWQLILVGIAWFSLAMAGLAI